jgi:hypothetical protein
MKHCDAPPGLSGGSLRWSINRLNQVPLIRHRGSRGIGHRICHVRACRGLARGGAIVGHLASWPRYPLTAILYVSSPKVRLQRSELPEWGLVMGWRMPPSTNAALS